MGAWNDTIQLIVAIAVILFIFFAGSAYLMVLDKDLNKDRQHIYIDTRQDKH